jgi:hypothetical protein
MYGTSQGKGDMAYQHTFDHQATTIEQKRQMAKKAAALRKSGVPGQI